DLGCGLRLRCLYPLVHLRAAGQANAGGDDTELAVAELRICFDRPADMHQRPFAACVHRTDANRLYEARAFCEGTCRLYRATLIPEQQDDHPDDEEQPEDDPAERPLDTPKP